MATAVNHVKAQLSKGDLSLGIGLRQARTVDIAKIARTCDFDWLFIDMEHNSMDVDLASQICVAALDSGITPIVRVPGHEHFHASRLLDGGALGIVVPHVDTEEQARAAVSHCRFPPYGKRSVPGGLPQTSFAALPPAEQISRVNEVTLVVVMLETPEAIANAEKIARVDGVDVLLVGAGDLTAEMGIPGQFDHPDVEAAFKRVIEVCARHGKVPGMGGVYEHTMMEKYIGLGAKFILSGSDLSFLMQGAKARSSFLRQIEVRQAAAE